MLTLLILLFLLNQAVSEHAYDSYYDIPSYYGHFSLQYFDIYHLKQGNLTKLEYHFAVDANYKNDTVYYASEQEHCVYKYDNSTQSITSLVGNCGSSGNMLGSIQTAQFNGVSSVAYFQPPSSTLLQAISQQQLLIVSDQSCNIDSLGCLLNPPIPPITITMSNLRFVNSVSLYEDEALLEQYLYMADTGNHCIKRLNFRLNEVDVVAGKCGSVGFQDGPLGYNLLNSPRNVGVSRKGVLYFFDSGNQYMRIVTVGLQVKTLMLGACKQYTQSRTIFGYKINQILCYQNWIQGLTQNPINHYFDPSILQICTSQQSQCK